jgi:hypothetical protein
MPDLLDALPVTRAEKIACLRRELGYRRRMYPLWVERRKMKQDVADRELRVMEAILADFEGGAGRE